jgi:hypothetical protein
MLWKVVFDSKLHKELDGDSSASEWSPEWTPAISTMVVHGSQTSGTWYGFLNDRTICPRDAPTHPEPEDMLDVVGVGRR